MTAKKRTTKKGEAADTAPQKKAAPRKKAAGKKAATTKAAAPRKKASKKKTAQDMVSAQDLFKMIQEAAYFSAMNDEFQGDPSSYWLAAEKEVRQRLGN